MVSAVTEAALPKPARVPWLLPAALFVVTIVALVAVVLMAREAGKSEAPPPPAAFVPPAGPQYLTFDVEASSGGELRIARGDASDIDATQLTLPPATRVWRLEPATPADLVPPLIANVVAIPNEVRNYSIRMMVFAPPRGTVSFDTALLPLADGFFGNEASRDPREEVVSSALLESFNGREGVTRTATGPGTLFVAAGAPAWLLQPIGITEIEPGDRVALHKAADGSPDVSKGVLVLQGGAR